MKRYTLLCLALSLVCLGTARVLGDGDLSITCPDNITIKSTGGSTEVPPWARLLRWTPMVTRSW